MSSLFNLPRMDNFSEVLKLDSLAINSELLGIEKIVIPCDVQNPLCGSIGAARMFGPQKGAKPD